LKLKIIIHRQTDKEPSTGTLRAWVDQNGRCSPNLLKGQKFNRVDSAVQFVDAHILELYKLIDPPEIEYEVEEWPPNRVS
jgi:hypothetical protein